MHLKEKYIDLILICLVTLTFPLFFYNLGQSSLVSWDEAWYGEIARNIIEEKNPFFLNWNGMDFKDHPPVGFWLIALGEKVFGYTNFGVRAVSAFCGLLTIIFVFALGKLLFNRWVGFASAVALTSSFWFLSRARSGNLDVFLTMFFVLTLYLAVKASKNGKYFLPFFISLAALFLTKTIVPITILPALLIIFWPIKLQEIKKWTFIFPLGLFLVIVLGWFYMQKSRDDGFVDRFLMIGLPGVKAQATYLDNFKLAKEYLHNGIGRWFWLGVMGVALGPVLFFKKRSFWILSVFFITFFMPFIFSSKGHIWHLVPLHPIMILAFFGFGYEIVSWLISKFVRLKLNKLKQFEEVSRVVPSLIILSVCFYFSYFQLRQVWYSFVDIPSYISDEEILSKEVGKYPFKFFLDADFGPSAVWYSGKRVSKISNEEIDDLFKMKGDHTLDQTFVLITEQHRLDRYKIPANTYKVLKRDRDRILVIKDK